MKKAVIVLLTAALASCVVISRRVDVATVSTREPVTVRSPVKAHLKDGSTIVYVGGVTVTADALVGHGERHDLVRSRSIAVETVPLSDVVGMESFRTRVNRPDSALLTPLTTPAI